MVLKWFLSGLRRWPALADRVNIDKMLNMFQYHLKLSTYFIQSKLFKIPKFSTASRFHIISQRIF